MALSPDDCVGMLSFMLLFFQSLSNKYNHRNNFDFPLLVDVKQKEFCVLEELDDFYHFLFDNFQHIPYILSRPLGADKFVLNFGCVTDAFKRENRNDLLRFLWSIEDCIKECIQCSFCQEDFYSYAMCLSAMIRSLQYEIKKVSNDFNEFKYKLFFSDLGEIKSMVWRKTAFFKILGMVKAASTKKDSMITSGGAVNNKRAREEDGPDDKDVSKERNEARDENVAKDANMAVDKSGGADMAQDKVQDAAMAQDKVQDAAKDQDMAQDKVQDAAKDQEMARDKVQDAAKDQEMARDKVQDAAKDQEMATNEGAAIAEGRDVDMVGADDDDIVFVGFSRDPSMGVVVDLTNGD